MDELKMYCRKILFIVLIIIFTISNIYAQKYKSVSSEVRFYSYAPIEDIEATNSGGKSAIDISTGEIVFSIPIQSFIFDKSLMQEHFNENYMESDKYPHATFKGSLTSYNPDIIDWQEAETKGAINIHGIEKETKYNGEVKINGETINVKAKFKVKLEDYKIKIPKVVFYNIAEVIDVTIDFKYERIK